MEILYYTLFVFLIILMLPMFIYGIFIVVKMYYDVVCSFLKHHYCKYKHKKKLNAQYRETKYWPGLHIPLQDSVELGQYFYSETLGCDFIVQFINRGKNYMGIINITPSDRDPRKEKDLKLRNLRK